MMAGKLQNAPDWLKNPLFGLASMLVIGVFAFYAGLRTNEVRAENRLTAIETRLDALETGQTSATVDRYPRREAESEHKAIRREIDTYHGVR